MAIFVSRHHMANAWQWLPDDPQRVGYIAGMLLENNVVFKVLPGKALAIYKKDLDAQPSMVAYGHDWIVQVRPDGPFLVFSDRSFHESFEPVS